MQLASVATCATACRCRSVTTRYARAAGSLGAQDRQTSGGGARSKARLMWGCSRRHPERQLPADMPDEVQSQWREWTAHYRRPHGLGTRQSAMALLVSDYSGCTDQNRSSVNAAGVCSYLSDRMSLSVRHYPLCACCWVAWCSRQTDRRAEEGLDPRRG